MSISGTVTTERPRESTVKRFLKSIRLGAACNTCGSVHIRPGDFRDKHSRREYRASGKCQDCQDEFFGN